MSHPRKQPSAIPVACLVLVDPTGAVLITQRPFDKQLGGLWEFPGGKVEIGESAEAALRRELSEELNLSVDALHPMTSVTHVYDFGTIRLIPLISRCAHRPTLELIEHSAFAWVNLSDLTQYKWAPADLPVLEELKTLLGGNRP